MKIYIGTSGYYYKWWTDYYKNIPASGYLEFYSRDFNSVEINNTFYRFPTDNIIINLKKILTNNKNFVYTIKINKIITHYKKLLNIDKYIFEFFRILNPIKNNIGCILFQFSKNFKYSDKIYNRFVNLADIYKKLRKINLINKNTRFIFEFRNNTFYNQENILELFKKNKFVFALIHDYNMDFKDIFNNKLVNISDILYFRFHGTTGIYTGSYSHSQLKFLAEFIKKSDKKYNYIYFNNTDINTDAIKDAKYLKGLFII